MTDARESVWEYPRPPRVEPSAERVVVRFAGAVVVDTTRAVRVLETSHPPTYYLPVDDVADGVLEVAAGASMCEFKGRAAYRSIRVGGRVAERCAWTYPTPAPGFEQLLGRIAIYPSAMDACEVDGELVVAQDGDFYGGWITSRVRGPFKGAPGTLGW